MMLTVSFVIFQWLCETICQPFIYVCACIPVKKFMFTSSAIIYLYFKYIFSEYFYLSNFFAGTCTFTQVQNKCTSSNSAFSKQFHSVVKMNTWQYI